uniref:Uncharacterized protein n=1 Tax=Arundo donax TaxID=35708 RepID=A0A0A8ZJN7_ARUDO
MKDQSICIIKIALREAKQNLSFNLPKPRAERIKEWQ